MALDSLTPYLLKGIEEVNRGKVSEDQCGSYGFVYSVKVGGLLRIAKKPHPEYLTNVSAAEKSRVLSNFKQECVLLSKLRHPNIVQFIGVYYEKNSRDDIALVMEKLQFDLAKFVSSESNIQLCMKLSILRDVTYGLVYLHEYNPPIIHRDLTARNILLTRSYQAKIADVGVSKLIDESAKKTSSYTKAPGQLHHMPPEALMEKATYTSKLDIFSFGHVCVHTLVGDYPQVFEVEVTPAMLQEGTIQKMRRLVSLDLIGSDHCLYPLITQCLMDKPDKRPTTREVNASLCLLVESHFKPAGGDEKFCSNARCQAMQHQIYALQEETEEKTRSITSLEGTVAHFQQEKNAAIEQAALAKVEAEIFKSDFEEERRDRTRAQGLLADFKSKKNYATIYQEQEEKLRLECDQVKRERNSLKRELSGAKAEILKHKDKIAVAKKEVLEMHIADTEKISRDRDYYRQLASKVKPLEEEVLSSKRDIAGLRSSIELMVENEKVKQKELQRAAEQIKHCNSVIVDLTTTLDKAKRSLSDAKLENQELKKAKRSLDSQIKKLEKTITKSGHQHPDVDESSFQHLYDQELQTNLELKNHNQFLEERIKDMTMEIEEDKKFMHEMTTYKFVPETPEEVSASHGRYPQQGSSGGDYPSRRGNHGNYSTPAESDMDVLHNRRERKCNIEPGDPDCLHPASTQSGFMQQGQEQDFESQNQTKSTDSSQVQKYSRENISERRGSSSEISGEVDHNGFERDGVCDRELMYGVSQEGATELNQQQYRSREYLARQQGSGSSNFETTRNEKHQNYGPNSPLLKCEASHHAQSWSQGEHYRNEEQRKPSHPQSMKEDCIEPHQQQVQAAAMASASRSSEYPAASVGQGLHKDYRSGEPDLPHQVKFSEGQTVTAKRIASQKPGRAEHYSEEQGKDRHQVTDRVRLPDTGKPHSLPQKHHDSDVKDEQLISKDLSAVDIVTQDKNEQKDKAPTTENNPEADESKSAQSDASSDTDDKSLHKDILGIEVMAQEIDNQVKRDQSTITIIRRKPMDPNLICPICGKQFRIGENQKFIAHVDNCV